MRIATAKFFEHLDNLLFRFYRLKIFGFKIVFFYALDSKPQICCARNCFTPNLIARKYTQLIQTLMSVKCKERSLTM